LHIHTKYSFDSSINPKILVEQLYAHPSVKVAAITDHDSVEGFHKVHELASTYEDTLIIPGVEITTPEGDLIVLGVTELPPTPWNVNDIIDFAKQNDAVVIVAHPYREYGLGSLSKNYAVDAIEVLNGSTSSRINRLAEDLAKQMRLPGVAGTDAHSIDDLWTVYTEIQAGLDVDEVLKAIKKGSVRVSSSRRSIDF
jgi:predicted metal-dependent phosphoesterase TrpH